MNQMEIITYEPQSEFTKDLYQSVQQIAKLHGKSPKHAFIQLVGLFRQMYGLDATQGRVIFPEQIEAE